MKKTFLLLGFWALSLNNAVAQHHADNRTPANAVAKKPNLLRNVSVGLDFYTFDDAEMAGTYPTLYSIRCEQYLKHPKHKFFATFNYYTTGPTPVLTTLFNFQQYLKVKNPSVGLVVAKDFSTVSLGYGYQPLPNLPYIELAGRYRWGLVERLFLADGIGWVIFDTKEDSYGMSAALTQQFRLGRRFFIAPRVQYEYYLQGTASQYLGALHFGYMF